MDKAINIDAYIAGFPIETQTILIKIRDLILELAPNAEEGISYGMSAYKTYKKPLVYFAGYKSHIGLYATPSGPEKFKQELSTYKQGKGSVQFPLDKPIPYDLISKIIKYRVEENHMKYTNNNI